MHLFEEEWMEGLRSGMRGLFDIDGSSSSSSSSSLSSGESKEEDEEGESDYDDIKGFDINDMDATLFERSEQFAQYWIHVFRVACRWYVLVCITLSFPWSAPVFCLAALLAALSAASFPRC